MIISREAAACVLCGESEETNNHLFFSCRVASQIWARICRTWDVCWVLHKELVSAFMAWQFAPHCGENRPIWMMFFPATIWSIWLHRNDIIFRGKVIDADHLMDLIRLRVAWWCKAKWPEISTHWEDLIREPTMLDPGKKVRRELKWMPPGRPYLKFNVDASVNGNPGEAGIGGILRDDEGKSLLLFSKNIGLMSPMLAELYAVKEACLIFIASKWYENNCVILESDCLSIVEFLNGVSSPPSLLLNIVDHVRSLCSKCRAQVNHCFREMNNEADELARNGRTRRSPLMLVFG